MRCRDITRAKVVAIMIVGLLDILLPLQSWSVDRILTASPERQERVSLAEAALQALQRNLDIRLSRHTMESRVSDIIIERAKFDPTVGVNGRFNRTADPLNRPVFGATGNQLDQIMAFDQRTHSFGVEASTLLLTGGNINFTYSPSRSRVNQDLAAGFLFNPAWTGGLTLTVTQPLLKNAGVSVNKTLITVAQNNAVIAQHIFRDQVLNVIASIEQRFWELVAARENVNVAQAALKAAEELLVTNRIKAEAGMRPKVDVLQAEAAVASRREEILVAEKAVRDQEDQFRALLNPGEAELRTNIRLTPVDPPMTYLEPLNPDEAIETAMAQHPDVLQAKKQKESSEATVEFARNQLLPTLSVQGMMGVSGLDDSYGGSFTRSFSGDFYNYGAGILFSYPLGNRSALSTYKKRQLEAENAETALEKVRSQIILDVREAVRRVQTDFSRIETTRAARLLAEKQLQTEQERLQVGLSTTRFVLDFQRDLATAQGREVRAIADYNKSLSNLARQKATTLDRYHLELS